jgi:predicted transcriptional regulator
MVPIYGTIEGGKRWEKLYTTAEAAGLLGLSRAGVQKYLERYPGQLGRRIGTTWLLSERDLAFIRRRQGLRGRRRK